MVSPSPHRLVIGARRSALARIQALAAGERLAQLDGAQVEYRFSRVRGDLSEAPDTDALVRSGGFTSDLGDALDAGAIDVAVHSWKDLPLEPRRGTLVAASLPRADCRDVVLVRRDAIARAPLAGLRVLSSSERRRVNVRPFLEWALPFPVAALAFLPVRGDIETRLAKLLAGDGEALVIAKAALDRMLGSTGVEFAAMRARVRAALDACRVMVVPLAASPAAPGQGALAIEVRRDRTDLLERLAAINDRVTFDAVHRERERLAAYGGDESPVGVSILPLEFGEVCFAGGEHEGARVDRVELTRRERPLPAPASPGHVWLGDQPGADPFVRVPLAVDAAVDGATGLLVARANALPEGIAADRAGVVWTAGLDTWRKLAARGVWVTGSDESLGETAAASVRMLFPGVTRWLKLSHGGGRDVADAERLATYRLERAHPPLPPGERTHFFWRSGTQFLEYLRAFPRLASAWHGCGPGNSWQVLRAAIGAERVRPYLSAAQFRAELGA